MVFTERNGQGRVSREAGLELASLNNFSGLRVWLLPLVV